MSDQLGRRDFLRAAAASGAAASLALAVPPSPQNLVEMLRGMRRTRHFEQRLTGRELTYVSFNSPYLDYSLSRYRHLRREIGLDGYWQDSFQALGQLHFASPKSSRPTATTPGSATRWPGVSSSRRSRIPRRRSVSCGTASRATKQSSMPTRTLRGPSAGSTRSATSRRAGLPPSHPEDSTRSPNTPT